VNIYPSQNIAGAGGLFHTVRITQKNCQRRGPPAEYAESLEGEIQHTLILTSVLDKEYEMFAKEASFD